MRESVIIQLSNGAERPSSPTPVESPDHKVGVNLLSFLNFAPYI
jgi:hypothetical protein